MEGISNIKNQALAERIEDHLFQYILDEGDEDRNKAAQ